MERDSYFKKYLFCITLLVCLSSQNIGPLKFVPILLLLLYVLYIIFFDFKLLLYSLIRNRYVSAFVFLMLLGIVRTNIPKQTFYQIVGNFLSLSLFYLSTSHIVFKLVKKRQVQKLISIIIIPFFFLGLLNLGLFFIGISKETIVARDTSVLMSLIGFSNFPRVNFFLVDGVNSYGSLNGVCLIMVLLSYIHGIYTKKFALIALAVFLLISLFTDSRGAIIFALFSLIVGLLLFKGKYLFLLKMQPYLTLLGPIIMFITLPMLVEFDSFSSLSRSDNDLASGNSRFFIWGLIATDFLNGESLLPFGYGDGGLYKTSSYQGISQIFEQYDDIVINAQNSLLTIILDFGVLSLIIFLIILISGIGKIVNLRQNDSILTSILGAILVYMLLIGLTEAIIGMYYQNSFVVFIYIFCLLSSIPLLNHKVIK